MSLQERAAIANRSHADLFVSIHTNSVDLKNPNRRTIEGASTYTLGLKKDKDNMNVARRENAVITYESDYNTKYSGFDPNSDESYIIFEMAQKANMAHSLKFADILQKQLTKVADRKNRGVKQAGFWVLWATSMPSVLVELDFITNPDVADFLGSDKGKNKLASAIYNATDTYFKALELESKNGHLTKNLHVLSDDSENAKSDVILASASLADDIVISAPDRKKYAGNNTSYTRRRRNIKAREQSENHEYEVAVIQQERDYISEDNPNTKEIVKQDSGDLSNKPKDKKKKDNKKKKKKNRSNKKERVVNGRKVLISEGSDKNKDVTYSPNKKGYSFKDKIKSSNTKQNNAPVKLEKKEVVYRIQILASADRLKTNNPRFCGLSPVSCTKSNDLYKYTYGETTDRAEIDKMLKTVRTKIPDAFVVSSQR